MVNLLKAAGAIAANAACMYQAGNSNFYTVKCRYRRLMLATSIPVTAINDRGGALNTIGGIMDDYLWTSNSLSRSQSTQLVLNSNGVPIGASSSYRGN